RNNDRVGAVLFTDRIEHVVPPRKGRRHALRLMRDLLVFEPKGKGTDLAGALEYTGKMLAHKTIIFVVSDFQAADLEQPLKLLAQRHDVVAVTVDDPSEQELPDIGQARFVDPETGATIDVDTSDAKVRARFAEAVAEEMTARRRLLRRLAIDEIPVRTDGGVVDPLIRFFRARETRARRR
ncbi:MAG: VWA domain-containing protein, partial [bacterium]